MIYLYLRITDTHGIVREFCSMVPNFLDKTHAIHTDTGVVDLQHFTTFYNKDLKMVQGLCARFSHRLYFRYARRQAVSGWGGGIEMVTPACLRSSFQLKRLAGRQVCHVIIHEWYQSEMVQVSSSPSQTWSAQICALANPLPTARHAALLSSMWTFTCMRVWAGEECCDVVCRCFSTPGVFGMAVPHAKIHQLLGRMISSYISSPLFLDPLIYWFCDSQIIPFLGISPRNMSECDKNSHELDCPGFQLDFFFGFAKHRRSFQGFSVTDLLEVFCGVQAHFMLW